MSSIARRQLDGDKDDREYGSLASMVRHAHSNRQAASTMLSIVSAVRPTQFHKLEKSANVFGS